MTIVHCGWADWFTIVRCLLEIYQIDLRCLSGRAGHIGFQLISKVSVQAEEASAFNQFLVPFCDSCLLGYRMDNGLRLPPAKHVNKAAGITAKSRRQNARAHVEGRRAQVPPCWHWHTIKMGVPNPNMI